jgi:hypothetical protein
MEMVMSEQTLPMGAQAEGISATTIIGTFFERVAATFRVSSELKAEKVRRTALRRYSESDLAKFGWSPAEIRRLKSN